MYRERNELSREPLTLGTGHVPPMPGQLSLPTREAGERNSFDHLTDAECLRMVLDGSTHNS